MRAAFFITGTDTGVGKTFFACSLAAALKAKGVRVGVFKPVESGCAVEQGRLLPADAMLLAQASGSGSDLSEICPYRLAEPLAPAEAAKRAGVKIDPGRIVDAFGRICDSHDVTIVEGAGGVLAPLYGTWTVLELIRELNLPVVNVVGSKLGAVSHALLTERAILDENVELVGHVVNNLFGADDPALLANPGLIAGLARRPVLGVLQRCGEKWLKPAVFESHVDLNALLDAD